MAANSASAPFAAPRVNDAMPGPSSTSHEGRYVEVQAAIDPALERRVRRKIDYNLMPLVMVLYLLAILDRSNIGNAKTAGMNTDLGFDDPHYQWLLTIFYIPYILFEPLAFMWKLVPPHIWAAGCVLIWGISSTLQAAAFSWPGLMACRFFLAAAEAAYGPGIPYLLSFFYKRRELGFRCAIFFSAAPLANTFAGALAYGITSGRSAIASWRVLFLVEGFPSIAMAAVAFCFMPDSADTARFLTPEEREVAKHRAIQQTGQDGKARIGNVQMKEVLASLKDLKTWIPPLMYFSINVSFSSLPVFLPDIIHNMGFSSVDAQGLTAPPYLLGFILCLITTYIADRTGQRGLMITAVSLLGGTGYVVLGACTSVAARYTGVFLAAAGMFPAIANILPWTLNNQGSDSKRGAGITLLNLIGQCGPLLGTRLFPAAEAPFFAKGMYISAGFLFLNAVLAMALRTLLAWENRRFEKRDKEILAAASASGRASVDESDKTGGKSVSVGVENEGYGFRNVL
ncbi:major facilitator superfamily domain-containing protein [Microdochium bolleyi]|uniref:Major facilitator superfamily domain-containing protein n=1 Tax=Microdochium bolleyi TaxID=196109 RepID=A0A136IXL5_9PEZI|nr:major facilitator superfamily domain-containing protein [Microdochium bolleyi]